MKTLTHRLAIALPLIAFVFAPTAIAQNDRTSTTARPDVASRDGHRMDLSQGVYIASIDAEERSLRHYAGQTLRNTEGAELGAVRDFVVHPASSRVRYAVVSSGGVLGGIGNSLRLVPFDALRHSRDKRFFEVDILQAAWLQVPPVRDEDFVVDRFEITAAQHDTMTQRFGSPARSESRTVETTRTTGSTTAENAFTGLIRASVIRGKSVLADGRHVGNIENIILDLDRGTAAALLDSSGEFTGTRGKYLVPLGRLQFTTPPRDAVVTTLTREDFHRAQPSTFTPLRPTAATNTDTDEQLAPTGRTDNSSRR
jgi:sporulation protein YlmC with PRC-barrel domain